MCKRILVQHIRTFHITLIPQHLQITVRTHDRVLDQIADDRETVRLSQRHTFPRNSPQHKDQLHIVFRVDGARHHRHLLFHIPINIDAPFPDLPVHRLHIRILDGIPKLAGFRGRR